MMWKQKKRKAALLLTAALCASLLNGCGGEMTPKKITEQVEENLTGVTSFSNRVEMDIKMEELVHYTKVTMDMTMENTMEPKAGHAKGTAEVTMRGVTLTSGLEIYQVEEGEDSITYSGLDGQWSKETAQESQGGIALDSNLFSEIGESAEEFQLAEESVEVEEKPCYEMYGNVTGQELIGILGSSMIHGFGLVELPDDSVVAELDIPVILDVYQENMLPARMIVDMTEVLNKLYDSLGETTDVTQYAIELSFTEYNVVGDICVPQEIQDTAKEIE